MDLVDSLINVVSPQNVATSCLQCYLLLNASAKNNSVDLMVHDLSVLVAESMQLQNMEP